MNHIQPEEQRDFQSRFTRCNSLQLPGIVGAEDAEKRSNSSRPHECLAAGRHAGTSLGSHAGQLIQLADFLLERHQSKNRVGDLRGTGGCERRFARRLRFEAACREEDDRSDAGNAFHFGLDSCVGKGSLSI